MTQHSFAETCNLLPPCKPSYAENPSAFPSGDFDHFEPSRGMSLRDWFAGQIVPTTSSVAPEWQLKKWFGEQTGLTGEQIRAKAAYALADAMLAERAKGQS